MTNRSTLSVPANWGGQDRRWAESLKENLDIILGNRGHALDRAVTFRDLLDTGVVQVASGVNWTGNAAQLEPVSNEFADLTIPPAPTNLDASGAFQNIILTWDLQFYKGHSFVEVFRHTSDDIANATLTAQVSGYTGVYGDPVGSGQTYYYWVRAVNQNDVRGPFNSSTGTLGQTQPDIAVLLDLLTDEITTSQLATSLADDVAKIDTLEGVQNSLETYTGYTSAYSGSSLLSRVTSSESSITTINSSITSINSSITSLNTATSNLQTSVSDLSANTADVYIQSTAPTGTIADNSRWYDTSDNNELHIYFDGDGDGDKEWVAVADPRISANETAVADLETEVFNTDGSSRLATAAALSTLNTTVINQGSSITSLTTDVTSLENEVFASDGSSLLATAAALNTTNTTVSSQGTNISTLQTDVTALEGEVFNTDGTARLATGSALSNLTSTVNTQGNSITTAQGDINTLEGEVFNNDGTGRLATGASVTTLTNTVTSQGNSITSAQQDITGLQGAVFNSDGTVKLATSSAVTGLTNDVLAIYDGTNPSVVKTVQTDVSSLEGAVFNSDGTVKLADTSTVSGLSNDIEAIYDGDGNPSLITTIQGDVTSLESEVFNSNGTSRLATASALTSLSQTVTSQGNNITSVSEDVTALENSVYDSNGDVKLASTEAVTLLQSEVWGDGVTPGGATTSRIDSINATITNPTTGLTAVANSVSTLTTEVFPNGTSNASRIDGLESTVFNEDGELALATSLAVSELETEVYGSGSTGASRIDGLFSEVFNSDGTSRLAAAEAFSTVETEVFPNGPANASRIDSLAAEVFEADGTLKLATAASLSTIQTEVFPNGPANASRIDQLSASVYVNGDPSGELLLATADDFQEVKTEVFPDGTASASRMDQLQVTLTGEDGTGGISGSLQTVQDLVSGDDGLTSQYMVKTDLNGYVTGFGFSSSTATGTPESSFIIRADKFAIVNPSAAGESTNNPSSDENIIVPFTVQANPTTLNGVDVPAGVYLDTAFIKTGSITTAYIADATIDYTKILSVDAQTISTGVLNTSRLNIDGASLTSDNGVLKVNELDANVITSGFIGADIMAGTTVYADNLTGDVNTINPFRLTTTQQFRGPDGEVTIAEVDLPASTHPDGHKVFANATGWLGPLATTSKVYYIKLYIRSSPSSPYVLKGETRFKSTTATAHQWAVNGVLDTPTTSVARMKITIRRYGSNGTTPDGFSGYDYHKERTGAIMGVR